MSKILVFNWKMNPLGKQASLELFEAVKNGLQTNPAAEVGVCPPFVFVDHLDSLKKQDGLSFKLGVQDVSEEEKGALTGQISAKMLGDFDLDYAIIGHSETRELWKLENENINRKMERSLEAGLTPILCIGYEKKPGNGEIDYEELKEQVLEGLENLEIENREILIAYEPVWAIGSGKTATDEIIFEVTDFLWKLLEENGFLEKASFKILYGGSVSDGNIEELSKIDGVDGFLVGGASLVPEKVEKMIEKL